MNFKLSLAFQALTRMGGSCLAFSGVIPVVPIQTLMTDWFIDWLLRGKSTHWRISWIEDSSFLPRPGSNPVPSWVFSVPQGNPSSDARSCFLSVLPVICGHVSISGCQRLYLLWRLGMSPWILLVLVSTSHAVFNSILFWKKKDITRQAACYGCKKQLFELKSLNAHPCFRSSWYLSNFGYGTSSLWLSIPSFFTYKITRIVIPIEYLWFKNK